MKLNDVYDAIMPKVKSESKPILILNTPSGTNHFYEEFKRYNSELGKAEDK